MRYFLFCFPRRIHFYNRGSGRGEKPWRGGYPPPDSDPFSEVESAENIASLSILNEATIAPGKRRQIAAPQSARRARNSELRFVSSQFRVDSCALGSPQPRAKEDL